MTGAPEDFPGTNVRRFTPKAFPPQTPRKRTRKSAAPPPPDDARPVIKLIEGEIERVVDEAEAALIDSDRGLYRRGDRIVSVGEATITLFDKSEDASLQIAEHGLHALIEDLTAAAVFKRFDARKEEWVVKDAPEKVAKTLQDRRLKLRLPRLTGIVTAPTLRPDGSVLEQPGYDAVTGLLYDPRGTVFPPIPPKPNKIEAAAALGRLEQLFSTMPFVSSVDRAVAVSALLTACSRNAYPTAPMHAITAPAAGTGKSMIVDALTMVATGRRAAVMAMGKNAEEFEKRLGGALLSGDPILALDNCEGGVGGELICQMLTQNVVKFRALGGSKIADLPTNILVTATGNNLVLVGDMTRRTVVCRINAREERPELRIFDTPDPVALAKTGRGQFVADALTVLRAYFAAGKPKRVSPLGSFEGWSRTVRDAMLWLGSDDPVASMEEGRRTDPKLARQTAVMTQWLEAIGRERVTAHQVIQLAERKREWPEPSELTHPEFRDALLAVAGNGGKIDPGRLGTWLGKNKDTIINRHVLGKAGASEGIQLWRLFEHGDPEWLPDDGRT